MRPHHKAEHMAAHDQIVKTPKSPCHAGVIHTGVAVEALVAFVAGLPLFVEVEEEAARGQAQAEGRERDE